MTVFGNRDFAPADPPVQPRAEAARPAVVALPEVAPLPVVSEERRVVIKVHGGEEIEVGRALGREPAVALAHDTIRLIESAQAHETWPEVADRFVRPDAIVSIDVQRADS